MTLEAIEKQIAIVRSDRTNYVVSRENIGEDCWGRTHYKEHEILKPEAAEKLARLKRDKNFINEQLCQL